MKTSKQLVIVIFVMILVILACRSESEVVVRPLEDTQSEVDARPLEDTQYEVDVRPLEDTQYEVVIIPLEDTQKDDGVIATQKEDIFNQLTFIPYDYRLTDIGNGMIRGMIFLAVENSSDRVFFTTESFQIKASVKTEQGVIYGAGIHHTNHGSFFLDYSSLGKIPPKFRFDDFVIYWDFSTVATPTFIVLTMPQFSNLEISIELPLHGTIITFPYDAPPAPLKTISSLNGIVLEDNPEGLKLVLNGECKKGPATNNRLMATLINQDKFYAHHEKELITKHWEMNVFFSLRYLAGPTIIAPQRVGNLNWTTLGDPVGPGQSKTVQIDVGSPVGEVLVWWVGDDYTLYDLTACQYE